MERHDDIQTPISNLCELMRMIERMPHDKYITSMKQYMYNPLAWLMTEKAIRASKSLELARPGESAQVPPELEHNGERTDCQVVGPLPASGDQPTTSRSAKDRPEECAECWLPKFECQTCIHNQRA